MAEFKSDEGGRANIGAGATAATEGLSGVDCAGRGAETAGAEGG